MFEQTLAPVINGVERVSTGVTRPLAEQLDNTFVLYQWFSEQYGVRNVRQYMSLLRGCNAAINRDALASIGGFSEDVAIGSDDRLSIKLVRAGIPICFVRDSAASTEYPSDLTSYILQQSRWLRVALHRSFIIRHGSTWQVGLSFFVYMAPVLLLVATTLLGRVSLYFAVLMLGYMLLTRVRIACFGQEYLQVKFPWKGYVLLPVYLVYDSYIRFVSLIQFCIPQTRWRW